MADQDGVGSADAKLPFPNDRVKNFEASPAMNAGKTVEHKEREQNGLSVVQDGSCPDDKLAMPHRANHNSENDDTTTSTKEPGSPKEDALSSVAVSLPDETCASATHTNPTKNGVVSENSSVEPKSNDNHTKNSSVTSSTPGNSPKPSTENAAELTQSPQVEMLPETVDGSEDESLSEKEAEVNEAKTDSTRADGLSGKCDSPEHELPAAEAANPEDEIPSEEASSPKPDNVAEKSPEPKVVTDNSESPEPEKAIATPIESKENDTVDASIAPADTGTVTSAKVHTDEPESMEVDEDSQAAATKEEIPPVVEDEPMDVDVDIKDDSVESKAEESLPVDGPAQKVDGCDEVDSVDVAGDVGETNGREETNAMGKEDPEKGSEGPLPTSDEEVDTSRKEGEKSTLEQVVVEDEKKVTSASKDASDFGEKVGSDVERMEANDDDNDKHKTENADTFEEKIPDITDVTKKKKVPTATLR